MSIKIVIFHSSHSLQFFTSEFISLLFYINYFAPIFHTCTLLVLFWQRSDSDWRVVGSSKESFCNFVYICLETVKELYLKYTHIYLYVEKKMRYFIKYFQPSCEAYG